jgi:hypothetical protein
VRFAPNQWQVALAFCPPAGADAVFLNLTCANGMWQISGPPAKAGDVMNDSQMNGVPCPGVFLTFNLRFSGCDFTATVTL